ncbi:hypothetical protein [Mesorhizobium sp. M0977]|uniref:hypothetical protein n=1 Tax=Mesorhizobium sp. M0977 TaxID=2957039 RepID=UPI00333982DD
MITVSALSFERRPIVGGAAMTEEFHPGFCASTFSYLIPRMSLKDEPLIGSPPTPTLVDTPIPNAFICEAAS